MRAKRHRLISGIWNSAVFWIPESRRNAADQVRIRKRMQSVPCWFRSPNAEAFQSPRLW